MASEAAENLKGYLMGAFTRMSDDESLKDKVLPVVDGIVDGSISAKNIAAFARTFRDALPNLKIHDEGVRTVLNMYHQEVVSLIPELEAEAAEEQS